jgi:2,4-dienoyl-CoA reductase-like NADH-dependent reductase (Old Yellow Enzyme family)
MTLDLSPLFQPFSHKSLHLANRICMAPMTRNFAAEHIPGESNASYYAKRAAGGVGLLITEGTAVNRPSSHNEKNIPFFHSEDPLAGWQGVAEAVHKAGGKIAPQLWHVGAVKGRRDMRYETELESPSGLFSPEKPVGRAMSERDIADVIASFAQAALDAKNAGFDCVEIHGAHGYLIDQFFWGETNTRADAYGGATLAERSRFACDILKAMRQAVGSDFAIILRLSQWKQQDYAARLATTPQALEAWLTPLVNAGADILHCSQRRFWEPEFPEIDGEKGLNFAGWAKKLTGAPTISVGSVGLDGEFIAAFMGKSSAPASLDGLLERMSRNEFDLIAVGRALISNPDWVAKVRAGDTASLKGFSPRDLGELV